MGKPSLRSIEGGRKGPPEPPNLHLQQVHTHLRRLAIALLRALARGNDERSRVSIELVDVAEHVIAANATLGELSGPVIAKLNARLAIPAEQVEDFSEVVIAALQVAAETCADDPAAAGRASQRKDGLRNAIEEYVIEQERLSRAGNDSYLKRLLKDHFSAKPPGQPR